MRIITTLFFLISFTTLKAQETIFTDRPNVTDAVSLLNKGTFQMELGYYSNKLNGVDSKASTIPNYSFKYGLTDNVELRIIGSYTSISNGNENTSGLSPITLSPKFAIFEPLGAVPKTSLAVSMTFPDIGKKDFQVQEFSYGFRGLFGYVFGKVSWDTGLGFDWFNGNDATPAFSSAVGYPVTDKLGVFGEIYGSGNEILVSGIDAGFTYLINNSLQIDIIFGRNLNDEIEYNEFGFGFGYKIN